MTTDPYVTTFFSSTHTQLTIVLSTTRRRRHDQIGSIDAPSGTCYPSDGCVHTAGASCGFSGHALVRIAQIRRGCCPAPARLLPLACGCCKPPLHRASQQLPLLSCFRRCTEPPSSSSLAPHRAAAHLFAGRLKDPIASTAAHEDELAERSCNASGPSAWTNARPRVRKSEQMVPDGTLESQSHSRQLQRLPPPAHPHT